MKTNTMQNNSVVPHWNEIKNWSREDRSRLVELITESLENETIDAVSGEFLSSIDENLMRSVAECVHLQYMNGECISHDEVVSRIREHYK